MRHAQRSSANLFAVAVFAFTPACAKDDIPVAMIVDSGIDAMPIPCGKLDGGLVGCEAGYFCDSTSGECDSTGFCDKIPSPDSCADQGFAPECDCNGVTYFNRCLRLAAGESRYKADNCLGPTSRTPKLCPTRDSTGAAAHCDAGESCVLIPPDYLSFLPDASLSSDSLLCRDIEDSPLTAFGSCWVLPDTCPLSSGHGLRACGGRCIDSCKQLKAGGTYFDCP